MSSTTKFVLVTDKGKNGLPDYPGCITLSATDFIANTPEMRRAAKLKVINLCNNYDYLGKGYYVSLLAEARGMRCVPSVSNIVTLNWKRNYQASLPELNGLLEKHFTEGPAEPLARTYAVYFGRVENARLEPLARRLFDLFRFPLMSLGIKYAPEGKWVITSIDPMPFANVPKEMDGVFRDALGTFTGAAWRTVSTGKRGRHWLAILHDKAERMPPSNAGALARFAKVGKSMGLFVEFINRHDLAYLLEYEALLIRETTAINHHTYRFAHKAESEKMPTIDDTQSIIRCCNKVFLHELLQAHKIPLPSTLVLDRKMEKTAQEIYYPAVVKIPDGAFSRGVVKVDNEQEFRKATSELFKKSEIVICQEFVPSEFDWRVGVLNNEPLFACQYYMAKDHWQIHNHAARTRKGRDGGHRSVAINKVPDDVLKVALKAAKLVGTGLYGVDLKQTPDGKVIVMEVNDNPNIDHGVEDEVLGDRLYKKILGHMIDLIER